MLYQNCQEKNKFFYMMKYVKVWKCEVRNDTPLL